MSTSDAQLDSVRQSGIERVLDLHRKKNQAKTDSEKELFEHQIEATDREIDELVFRLYGLTEEEIKVVKKNETYL